MKIGLTKPCLRSARANPAKLFSPSVSFHRLRLVQTAWFFRFCGQWVSIRSRARSLRVLSGRLVAEPGFESVQEFVEIGIRQLRDG